MSNWELWFRINDLKTNFDVTSEYCCLFFGSFTTGIRNATVLGMSFMSLRIQQFSAYPSTNNKVHYLESAPNRVEQDRLCMFVQHKGEVRSCNYYGIGGGGNCNIF